MTGLLRSTLLRPALLVAAGLLAGCSLQPPAEEMSQAGVAVAQAAGMSDAIPATELKRAQDKMALAQRWIAAGDHGPARWLAEQAQVDAELALARAAARDSRRTLAQPEQGLLRTSYPQASILAEQAK